MATIISSGTNRLKKQASPGDTNIGSILYEPNGTSKREIFTATANQTVFTPVNGYDPGYVDVYLNGRKLQNSIDVTLSSGTDIVLAIPALAGDILDVVIFGTFNVANVYTQSEADALFSSNSIGYNQTWQDVTASRLSAVNYTNSTGKPIQMYVIDTPTVVGQHIDVTIDGLVMTTAFGSTVNYTISSGVFIIPNGSVYQVTGTFINWFELR